MNDLDPPDHAQAVSFSDEYRVPFGETDAAGVVFYPNYYRWFDRMTHELFRSVGQPLDGYMSIPMQAPILAETQCRFLASVRYDDLVELHVRVTEVRARSFRLDHTVRLDGHIAAEGYEVRVWAEIENGAAHPATIPQQIRHALLGQPGEGRV